MKLTGLSKHSPNMRFQKAFRVNIHLFNQTLTTVRLPNNNHPKRSQKMAFNWNGLFFQRCFLIPLKKHTLQNPWMLFRLVAVWKGVIVRGHCIISMHN